VSGIDRAAGRLIVSGRARPTERSTARWADRSLTVAARIGAAALAVVFATSITALAQSGGTYTIRRSVIAGGGGLSSGGTLTVHGTVGQHDAEDLGGGTYTLRGGFWHPAAEGGTICVEDEECNDSNACTYDECDNGLCSNTPRVYGDVGGNGARSLLDVFCILDLIGGSSADPACNVTNADIDPCTGNGVLALFDIFAVLDAIGGIDPCCGGPADKSMSSDLETVLRPESRQRGVAAIRLIPSARAIDTGDTVSVDVLVSGVADFRGYEIALEATGGKSGALVLEAVSVDAEREDYVFGGREVFDVGDVAGSRVVAATASGGVNSYGQAYLATFTFRATKDAYGSFEIGPKADGLTVLADSAGAVMMMRSMVAASIHVR
jgi:hypothetical protein